jgi:hypothetical protein
MFGGKATIQAPCRLAIGRGKQINGRIFGLLLNSFCWCSSWVSGFFGHFGVVFCWEFLANVAYLPVIIVELKL